MSGPHGISVTYTGGLDPALDAKLEEVIGVPSSASGCCMFEPYERDIQFDFTDNSLKQMEAAGERVAALQQTIPCITDIAVY